MHMFRNSEFAYVKNETSNFLRVCITRRKKKIVAAAVRVTWARIMIINNDELALSAQDDNY